MLLEGRDVLTLRYTATYRNEKISATHTFFKLYDGSPSYTFYVESENATTFPAMKRGCHFKYGGISSGIFPYAVNGKVFPLPTFRLEIV